MKTRKSWLKQWKLSARSHPPWLVCPDSQQPFNVSVKRALIALFKIPADIAHRKIQIFQVPTYKDEETLAEAVGIAQGSSVFQEVERVPSLEPVDNHP